MKVILQIQNGAESGREIEVLPGEARRIGRQSPADAICAADSEMSVLHFAIECFPEECRIRDLNSKNGTLVNDVRVPAKILAEGDRIRAGKTEFQVRVEGSAAGNRGDTGERTAAVAGDAPSGGAATAELAGLTEEQQAVLRVLREQPEPLFAILDAARDGRALDLLRKSKEHYESLYEGKQGEDLANFAPYLVELPKDSSLLISLVKEGWGKSWGIYLTCKEPFKEVRKHFRHFLLMEMEDGTQFYFRFYDPRVLRVFIPSNTEEERAELFGPVKQFIMEDVQTHVLLRFAGGPETWKKVMLPGDGPQSMAAENTGQEVSVYTYQSG